LNAALLAILVFALFLLGYRFYARFLSERIFALAEDEPVPAREFEDGIDYVPTRKAVLWGHHFTSIAGAAPIVGPAIAVIWGWLPALLWVALGTLMMGAVHDFAALVISLRHRGRSIGEISGHVISPRVRTLFLVIVSVLIWIVLAVFAFIIGTLFVAYPGSIFPINVQIGVAMGLALGFSLSPFVLIGVFFLVFRSKIGLRRPPPPSTRASTPTPARPPGLLFDWAASRDAAACHGHHPRICPPVALHRASPPCPQVQRAPPPIEQRVAAASPRRAAAPPPRGSPHGCTVLRCRCVAPSGRSAAARGPHRRPEAVPVVAPSHALPLRRPFGP
jgi:hypothetical protein